jgi:hypothetical protein
MLWAERTTGLLFVATILGGCADDVSRPGELYDGGMVYSPSPKRMRHVFHVVNTTGEQVKILDKSTSCGCTNSQLGKLTLGPGEATTLELSTNAVGGYGKVELSCRLRTDNQKFRDWDYLWRFENVPSISIQPSYIDLGTVKSTDVDASGFLKKGLETQPLRLDVFQSGQPIPEAAFNFRHADGLSVQSKSITPNLPIGNNLNHRRFSLSAKVTRQNAGVSRSQSRRITISTHDGSEATLTIAWQAEAAF